MPRRLVLHAGPHKTGTTALQATFAREAARLAAAGVLYPAAGRAGAGHHALAEACRTGDTVILEKLAAEAHETNTVLLSSENFAPLDARALGRLRETFPDTEVTVVYMLRRLAALWPSHWGEMVKHGQAFSFAEYLLPAATGDLPPFVAPPLPPRQIGALVEAFGAESLRLPIYDAWRAGERDVGPAFADEILGLQNSAAFVTAEMNFTPPYWETELVRIGHARVRNRLDYSSRMRFRAALLAELRAAPPPWLARLRDAVAAAPLVRLTEESPLVRAMQTEVVTRHEEALLDSPRSYLAPIVVEVPIFEAHVLAAADRTEAARLFDRIAAATLSA